MMFFIQIYYAIFHYYLYITYIFDSSNNKIIKSVFISSFKNKINELLHY